MIKPLIEPFIRSVDSTLAIDTMLMRKINELIEQSNKHEKAIWELVRMTEASEWQDLYENISEILK